MDPVTESMLNLPSFSSVTLFAILIANMVMLFAIFVLAGPAIISGQDMLGRPLGMDALRRGLVAAAILAIAIFLAAQAVMVWRYWPYYLDPGETKTEQVLAVAAVPAGDPVVWWIATENHRFGVVEEIYQQIDRGDLVKFRYRPVDDALFEIQVLAKAKRSRTSG